MGKNHMHTRKTGSLLLVLAVFAGFSSGWYMGSRRSEHPENPKASHQIRASFTEQLPGGSPSAMEKTPLHGTVPQDLPDWMRASLDAAGIREPLTPALWEAFLAKTEQRGIQRVEMETGYSLACMLSRVPDLRLSPFMMEVVKEKINEPDASGLTPLAHAALSGDPRTIEALLAAGADLYGVSFDESGRKMTLLNYALQATNKYGSFTVSYLMGKKGFTMEPAEDYFPDLMGNFLYQHQYLPQVIHQMDINTRYGSFSAFELGLKSGMSTELIDAFLNQGVDVKGRAGDVTSALHMVSINKNFQPDQALRILSMGADPNAAMPQTLQTPVHYAVMYNRPDLLAVYMQNGGRADVKDRRGETPVDYLKWVRHKNPEEIALLRNILENKNSGTSP
jgi:ankyrin repeat protein